MEAGFDNSLYIHKQTEHIRQRIAQWGGKLYLEFGGKLFDDYHAARVLPGFDPNGKPAVRDARTGRDHLHRLGGRH